MIILMMANYKLYSSKYRLKFLNHVNLLLIKSVLLLFIWGMEEIIQNRILNFRLDLKL